MSQKVYFRWHQGADLRLSFLYKEGATLLDLSSGYDARMDVFTLAAPNTPVVTCTTENGRIILSKGRPNITVVLERALTLPGGAVHPLIAGNNTFGFDLFLRNTFTNHQAKVIRGSLKMEKSGTQWL